MQKPDNPLLDCLEELCEYLFSQMSFINRTRDIDLYYSDYRDRKKHFIGLLEYLSDKDIDNTMWWIKKGKSDFGNWKIWGYAINPARSHRYATKLAKLQEDGIITRENIQRLPQDLIHTRLHQFILHIFSTPPHDALTHELFNIENPFSFQNRFDPPQRVYVNYSPNGFFQSQSTDSTDTSDSSNSGLPLQVPVFENGSGQ